MDQENPLEKGILTTHSSILAWIIPWTEELGGLQSMELQRVGHDLAAKHAMHASLGEGGEIMLRQLNPQ